MDKSTLHLVDSELHALLEQIPAFEVNAENLSEMRESLLSCIPPVETYARDDVTMERRSIPGPDGGPEISLNILGPKRDGGLKPALLHIHGGGYILGTVDHGNVANTRTASEVGCVVVSVDYRLSPEAIAPAAVHDCYAALKWLHDNAYELGVDRDRIAVGGESAGGGLAANLALYARDQGEISPCFQLLIYPMLDDRTATRANGNPHVGEFMWTRDANAFGWASLLGQEPGLEDVPPYSVAARAENLSNLPPAYIYVGSLDLFLEEDVDYAMRMLKSGGSVELHIFDGAYHGFEMALDSRAAIEAEMQSRAALKRAFEKATQSEAA